MSGYGQPDGSGPRHFGVYPAVVTSIVDEDNLGRVQVRLPWLGRDGDREVRAWATLCSPYADADQGLQIVPSVGSHVVVAFEAGRLERPYVVGAAWHGQKRQPFRPAEPNNIRTLTSRAGSRIEFDDTAGRVKVTIRTPAGNTVILDDGDGSLTVRHSSGAGQVRLTADRVFIEGPTVEVKASLFTVNAPMARFSGAVNCVNALASATVTSPAYSSGAGNFW